MASTAKGKGATKTSKTAGWRKHMRPEGKKEAAKNVRRDGKKIIKDEYECSTVKESNIVNFINAIIERNYSDANKYLSNEVDRMLIDRMKKEYSNKIF